MNNISTDSDLIFKTLEGKSKKLGIFGERYSNDSLQNLSKLKYALLSDYDRIFTYLNTNEERMKIFIVELETSKVAIASHFKIKIVVGDQLENSMICAITGMCNMPHVKHEIFCEFCNIQGHTSHKGRKPYCF